MNHCGDFVPLNTVGILYELCLACCQIGKQYLLKPNRYFTASPRLQIVFAALLAVAVALPQKPEIRVIDQRFDIDQQGNYEYAYQQDNGQVVEEVGRVQPGPEPETGLLTQQGGFSFVGDDGNTYSVSYVANDGGFQPQADHLPVAPAQIPEYEQLRQEHPELF